MKFDVLSLGDHLPDPHTGRYNETQAERFQMWVDLGVLAEERGYDAFWIGEHHCSDYIVSSPQMVLAAIASRTRRINLGTAVSLLPTNDPVRLAEDFATLDLLSNGRAEIGFGSGFTEHTFKLFDKDLEKSVEISVEHLGLLERLWNENDINWEGRFRAPIHESRLQPRTFRGRSIPINRATASTVQTAAHAGRAGHKLMVMSVAGRYSDMKPLVVAYREAYREAGHDPAGMSVAAVAYVHVRKNGQEARDFWYPYRDNYRAFTKALTESKVLTRGVRVLYDRLGQQGFAVREPDFCGDPAEIIDKTLKANEDLGGFDRLMCFVDCGGVARADVLANVELFAEAVIPKVNAALARG
jgi:alkanesulfonate monooxygenase SsuD/methylene tetrahydromethanopterin reductase-like flavin-dependent oxidoreductase (luciferase family)